MLKLDRRPKPARPVQRPAVQPARVRLAGLALLPACLALAARAPAQPAAEAHITYLSASTVYIDAGGGRGLREGDRVEVVRDGGVVAVLRVEAVSSQRAACRQEGAAIELAVGDRVRLAGATATPEASGSGGGTTSTSAIATGAGAASTASIAATTATATGAHRAGLGGVRPWLRRLGLRGHLALRLLGARSGTDFGQDYDEPALDLRAEGPLLPAARLDFALDLRTRRTYLRPASGATVTRGRSRIYELAAGWRSAGEAWRLALGRQSSASLAPIQIFDGILAEYRTQRWSAGAFTGVQPDPVDFGFSRGIREHGVFVELRNPPGAASRWTATGGLVGSYAQGEINRESVYLQGSTSAGRFSGSLIQEIDLNRGWKRAAGEAALSLTSTYLSTRYRLGRDLTLDAGYDTRRNLRLYRDRVTPETEFDDSYRQGYWAGVDLRLARLYRVNASYRRHAGGSAGSADSGTLRLSASWPRLRSLSVAARSTRYFNPTLEGWMISLEGGVDLAPATRLDLTWGSRDETGRDPDLRARTHAGWQSFDLEHRLSQPWYLVLSAERSQGYEEQQVQYYTSAVYRF